MLYAFRYDTIGVYVRNTQSEMGEEHYIALH